MILLLLAIPCLGALAAFVLRSDRVRRKVLVATAMLHLALVVKAWKRAPQPVMNGWLGLDAAGMVFLSVTSVLFLAASIYAAGYLRQETQGRKGQPESGTLLNNAPEAVFSGCLLLFLATMTLVVVSRHFGLLWVAVEATTLASAPLIYFHRHDRSLEATWKYLLLCSVGIAVALLGTFFLAVAAAGPGNRAIPLVAGELIRRAGELNIPWLKAAFLLLLIGYGTKMGLAPMHTWLPDAHSEAPAVVSALLSGALLNCAFLGILRLREICAAAGQAAYGRDALIALGLLSMAVAAVFIIGQRDYKRLLAYSSIEHMGIMALGIGLGGAGVFGAIFHAVNHAFAKGMVFLVAGNILSAHATKSADKIRGLWQSLPVSGALWVAGFFAIAGAPPFGTFWSELIILKAALEGGRPVTAAAFLLFLAIIFIAMTATVMGMAQGENTSRLSTGFRETIAFIAPPAVLGGIVLLLGLYLPSPLRRVLHETAVLFGGL
ncbi:NADH dehydrogenase FAD-containing subunit [candidate division FCPU426 bacterium]|nr:NADH dehydrogenase FAD-containing subunit [candidate division FCPU426 bacterium]